MRPNSLWLEWETVDGRRRRVRFEPADEGDHPDAVMVRYAEVYDEDADDWRAVGNEDVVDCKVDMQADPEPAAEVFTGP